MLSDYSKFEQDIVKRYEVLLRLAPIGSQNYDMIQTHTNLFHRNRNKCRDNEAHKLFLLNNDKVIKKYAKKLGFLGLESKLEIKENQSNEGSSQ